MNKWKFTLKSQITLEATYLVASSGSIQSFNPLACFDFNVNSQVHDHSYRLNWKLEKIRVSKCVQIAVRVDFCKWISVENNLLLNDCAFLKSNNSHFKLVKPKKLLDSAGICAHLFWSYWFIQQRVVAFKFASVRVVVGSIQLTWIVTGH